MSHFYFVAPANSNYQIEVIELEVKKKVKFECTVEGGITKIPCMTL